MAYDELKREAMNPKHKKPQHWKVNQAWFISQAARQKQEKEQAMTT